MTIKTSDSLPVVPDDREVRKTNELISRPLVRGHFSLLARKVFNAMLFHAQDQKQPGRNAPGESDAYKRMSWVPLTDIGRDAKFDSGDTAMLKEVARQLMDIQVENESDTEWDGRPYRRIRENRQSGRPQETWWAPMAGVSIPGRGHAPGYGPEPIYPVAPLLPDTPAVPGVGGSL